MDGIHHVWKYGDKYCRFGSYATVTFVDTPGQATLYTLERMARKRVVLPGGVYYNNGSTGVPATDFKLVRVTLRLVSEEAI